MRLSSIVGAFTSFIAVASAATFTNPLKPVNGSDPQLVYDGGYYYLMTTTWTNLQITRARTLEGLKTGETRVVYSDPEPSRCCNVWAPELHKIGNRYEPGYPPFTERRRYADRMEGGTSITLPAIVRTLTASVLTS